MTNPTTESYLELLDSFEVALDNLISACEQLKEKFPEIESKISEIGKILEILEDGDQRS